ncbi:MazG nucleotide pyrophosphohydrolase domain-containing protein [Alkalithermobacter thermoalcaliphilus JW-YL-7 = DSM 7308]|uniref:MazG nucleotide pyrophosphohydrolase n=1 Tax=Alkalithermobacter thermoalcaliphilus JW-YL-7 = DSM 7308 TaxID=1121328 RepID=A0A150FMS4_CLOPD|nr:MazG nucleotide pyrophosphohydrolase [[Clostridium] paradoxum JW-YL-7 = DSM 7308]SHL26926.1 MazG nucleotide pyrophosphohydrolase domain-containing protein [[Clostridium] paradoxum JW-YL-7 = DSM 7308]
MSFDISKFKSVVNESLIRHKSILDVLTKLQETNSRINRAVIKSVTSCGCIQIDCKKQDLPKDITFGELSEYMDSHIRGDLCDVCKEKIEQELGDHMFYITALCNLLNMDLEDILKDEYKKITTLGKYSLF